MANRTSFRNLYRMETHVVLFSFSDEFGVLHLNDWPHLINIIVISHQGDDVVRVEGHVFIREVVGVFSAFNAYHADFEIAAEHGVFQLFAEMLDARALTAQSIENCLHI